VVLRRRLPRRRYQIRAGAQRPPIWIWTDAMYTEGQPPCIAFVVRIDGRYYHGSLEVPASFMRKFVESRQYIGQLELLAAISVYFSMPDALRGRRVIHMIDNQSAVAALIKGYARAVDSVRIVHAFAAFNLGLGVSTWFEWVPSKANIADLPSRGDFALLSELGSTSLPLILPDVAAWDDHAGAWMDRAEAGASLMGEPPAERSARHAVGRVLVAHLRQRARDEDVRVDRTSGSPMGNPFPVGFTAGASREAVCAACEAVLRADEPGALEREASARQWPLPAGATEWESAVARRGRAEWLEACAGRVLAGRDVRLMCHCYPRRCHAEGLAALIRERAAVRWAERLGKRRR
jgi:hypothetical protein